MRCAAYLVNAYLFALEVLNCFDVRIRSYCKLDTALVQSVNDLYIDSVLDRREELEVTVNYRDRAVVKTYFSCFKIRRNKVYVKALISKVSVFICYVYRCAAKCTVSAGNVYFAVLIISLACTCRVDSPDFDESALDSLTEHDASRTADKTNDNTFNLFFITFLSFSSYFLAAASPFAAGILAITPS